MTSHRIIYDSSWTNNLRGDASTKNTYIENGMKMLKCPTPTKIVNQNGRTTESQSGWNSLLATFKNRFLLNLHRYKTECGLI